MFDTESRKSIIAGLVAERRSTVPKSEKHRLKNVSSSTVSLMGCVSPRNVEKWLFRK
jgi:hypothetical protein